MKIILIAKLYYLIEWLTKVNKILYESNKILIIQLKYCPIKYFKLQYVIYLNIIT